MWFQKTTTIKVCNQRWVRTVGISSTYLLRQYSSNLLNGYTADDLFKMNVKLAVIFVSCCVCLTILSAVPMTNGKILAIADGRNLIVPSSRQSCSSSRPYLCTLCAPTCRTLCTREYICESTDPPVTCFCTVHGGLTNRLIKDNDTPPREARQDEERMGVWPPFFLWITFCRRDPPFSSCK